MNLRLLIASGAGGGTSKGSVGKYFHLKEFGDALTKFGVEYKLIREFDYVTGFPSKNIRDWIPYKRKFKKLIKEFKPDVILVDRQSHFALQVIKSKIPLFVMLRGHYWSELKFARETLYKGPVMSTVVSLRNQVAEKVFEHADVLLPICNYLVNVIKEYHPRNDIEVFIEGVDSSKWYKTSGMDLKHPCVGLLQDANWWRKTKEMLTLETVLKSLPDVNFYWAGDGQYKDQILSVLSKYENFHWLGSLEYPNKVRDFLTEIDVYALITGMDTTPLSLKEAQLMKNPVIATNVGGNSEIMIDSKTGFLVEEGNANQIIEKLTLLFKDKDLAIKLGNNGYEFIKNEFSLEVSAKNFLRIIKSRIKKLNLNEEL